MIPEVRRHPDRVWPAPADPAASVSIVVSSVVVAEPILDVAVRSREVPTGWAWRSDLPLGLLLNEPSTGLRVSGVAGPIAVSVSAGPPGLFVYEFIDLEAPGA